MLSILFVHHLVGIVAHGSTVAALPISTQGGQLEVAVESAACSDLGHCRTLWNIMWSCLATIFACTWLAIHPNIPAPDEGFTRVNLRRAKIMVVGLLAPELIILWAMRQWLVAHLLAKKYEKYGWTQTHGFFALMGGFTVLGKDGRRHPFLLHNLGRYLESGDIKITKKEIEDRSKGDVLSKGVVLVQTGWFIINLIARAVERLPTTELELVALAFAVLNFTTYGVWWNKPLDVQCPILLTEPAAGVTSHATLGLEESYPSPLLEEVDTVPTNLRQILTRGVVTVASYFRNRSVMWLGTKILGVFDTLISRADEHDFESFFINKQRVPTFYWGTDLADRELCSGSFGQHVHGVVTLIATIFGAIHCIAWKFEMPTEAERIMWRVAACLTVVVPLPYSAAIGGFSTTPYYKFPRQFLGLKFRYWEPIIIGALFLYVVSRVTLLGQAFVLLRGLPAGAYTTVHWTTFIPHF